MRHDRLLDRRVARLAFSRPVMTNLAFFKTVGLKICENLFSSWPFFPKSLFGIIQNLAFLTNLLLWPVNKITKWLKFVAHFANIFLPLNLEKKDPPFRDDRRQKLDVRSTTLDISAVIASSQVSDGVDFALVLFSPFPSRLFETSIFLTARRDFSPLRFIFGTDWKKCVQK